MAARRSRSGRAAARGGHQRRHVGALPLLRAFRGLPAPARLRRADLRLPWHRRIASRVPARFPGIVDGLGRKGLRGGAGLCAQPFPRPAGGRGGAQHRRFRHRPGALGARAAPHFHHGRPIRLLARLRRREAPAHAGQMACRDAAAGGVPGLFSGAPAGVAGRHAARRGARLELHGPALRGPGRAGSPRGRHGGGDGADPGAQRHR